MRTLLLRWASAGIVLLIGLGFDLSNFVGSTIVAYAVWVVAAVWIMYLAWPATQQRFWPWVRRARLRSPFTLARADTSSTLPQLANRTEITTSQAEHNLEANSELESSLEFSAPYLDEKVGDLFLREELQSIIQSHHNPVWLKYLSILMVDIDDLTVINKQYGEKVGDNVLTIIANIIQDVTNTRYFGRCGEDTFFSVLLDCDIDEAKVVAERLRTNVQDYSWSTLAVSLRVTCSIGLAQLGRDAKGRNENAKDLIVRATIGMDRAKMGGRNRVVVGPSFLSRNQSRDLSTYYS